MSNDKDLVLFEHNENIDKIKHENYQVGKVTILDSETKFVKFKGFNKVIVSGSAFTASKHFNIKPKVFTPSYNTVLGLDHTVPDDFEGEGIRKEEQVFLFAVGTSGCGDEPNQVFDVDYTKWIQPEDLVPFRWQNKNNDLGTYMRDKYFGRKTESDGSVKYYFKAFEAPPEIKQEYADGTPIDENIYLSDRKDEVSTYVELNLKITKDDCRDFFLKTTGIKDARVNAISILTAYKVEYEGFTYYQNIRPLTLIHFPSELLVDISKGIDVIYQIFY